MKRILFYSPFGSRTGSDMMLSYIIKNIDMKKFQPVVFSEKKWALMENENSKISVYFSLLESSRWNRLRNLIGKLLMNRSVYENQWIKIIKKHQPDLIYLNTIVVQNAIPVLKKVNVPFAVHCHELIYSYQFVTSKDLEYLTQNSQFMIACSEKVGTQLKMLGAKKVMLLPEAIDPQRIESSNVISYNIRERWNIPNDGFLWIMAGLRHYRKGFDFIPVIAKILKEHNGWLLWTGKSFDTGYDFLVRKQIEAERLDNVLLLEEQDKDYFQILQAADGLVLTSREDPFPLVMIEAAWLGKPIVAFRSGGVEDFLLGKMGVLVNCYNLDQMQQALIDVMKGKVPFDAKISNSRAKQFAIQPIIRQWEEIIGNYFGD